MIEEGDKNRLDGGEKFCSANILGKNVPDRRRYPKGPGWWPERERGTEGSAGGTGRVSRVAAGGQEGA